jgi:hypothetical protein
MRTRARRCEPRALPLAQVRRHLEQQVLRGCPTAPVQRLQQAGREAPGARPELEYRAAAERLERGVDRRGAGGREQRRELRRRDEVAVRAELRRARAVVPEARGVQHEAHVLGERNPALAREPLAQRATHRSLVARGGERSLRSR